MKKLFTTLLLIATLFGLVGTAAAADFRYSTDQNGSVNIATTDQTRDLHVVSSTVNVTGNVMGDLLAAGQDITVSGNVENSSFLAGSTVLSTGNVGHHLRIVGNDVTISGTISGDLYIAAQTITINNDTTINGSAYLAAETITVNGSIKGALVSRSSDLVLNGTAGSVNATTETAELQSKAVVLGDFTYKSLAPAAIDSAAKINGQTNYTKVSANNYQWLKDTFSIFALLLLLGGIILLVLVGMFWPRTTKAIITSFSSQPLKLFGIGLVTLILGPIALIFLLFTYVGIPFAIVIGLLWALAFVLASLFSKLAIGSLILGKLTKEEWPIDWQAAVVGALVYLIIGLIPVIGPITGFTVTMIAFGAVVMHFAKTERAV